MKNTSSLTLVTIKKYILSLTLKMNLKKNKRGGQLMKVLGNMLKRSGSNRLDLIISRQGRRRRKQCRKNLKMVRNLSHLVDKKSNHLHRLLPQIKIYKNLKSQKRQQRNQQFEKLTGMMMMTLFNRTFKQSLFLKMNKTTLMTSQAGSNRM